ncbi:hypothetical protein ACQPX6_19695 [Actinomycetospora sp. CA-101289]|uniref:hypothetical protein n=1 Tax=Actinomycetospora sp. CA-101289 TaxID=3239893 RepID=UPI003D9551E0
MTAVPSDLPVSLRSARPIPSRTAGRRHHAAARHPSPLARTVEQALTRLDSPTEPVDHAARRARDHQLRTALTRHIARAGEGGPAVPAVRVACAHLAAGDTEWAYLALLTARDQLG